MLVVDLLKTVGLLANAVTQKTKELDRLKAEYEAKIRILDTYIAKVTEELPETNLSGDKETTELLQKELRCLQCLHLVYSLNEQSDYILVPRKAALREAKEVPELLQSLERLKISAGGLNTNTVQSSLPPQPQSKKHHGKLKRTCSYCDQPGHTRARCLDRLNGQPPKSQS